MSLLTPTPSLGARKTAALAAIALAALLSLPSVGRADNYVINNGPSAPTPNASVGPWTVFGGPQGNKTTWSLTPGDYIGPLGASIPKNASAGVRLSAPAGSGITIREAKLWWYAPHTSGRNNVTVFAGTDVTNLSSSIGGPVNRLTTPDDFVLAANTTLLQLWTSCTQDNGAPMCLMASDSAPDLELAGSQLTLNDPGAPSGAVTAGGLDSTGTLSGAQSISYEATDGVSGVRKVELLVDGQVVNQVDYLASCPYDNFLACPASASGSLSWNTATVPDGTHDVELEVINPSNNATVVDDHTITTANAPVLTAGPAVSGTAASGQTLTAVAGTTSSDPAAGSVTTSGQWLRCDLDGSNCSTVDGATGLTYLIGAADVGQTIRYRENAANSDGSSIAESDATGPVTDPDADAGGTTTGGGDTTGGDATGGPGATGVGGGGQTSGAGGGDSPIAPVIVDQTSTPPTAPPAGTPSRPIAGPLGTSAPWRVSLSVGRRTVRSGASLMVAGVVATTPRPASGKLVELQVRRQRVVGRGGRRVVVSGPWVTVVALRTDATGRFQTTVSLSFVRGHSAQVRAVAPREGGYRNGQGISSVVSVTSAY